MKGFVIFLAGILLAIATVGTIVVRNTFFASADPDLTPRELQINRVSPTAGEIKFITDKEAIARIECSTNKTGPFELCGAENASTLEHTIKTSLILDPEKEYFFLIKIGNNSFDNLGIPLVLPKENDVRSPEHTADFPADLLGLYAGSAGFQVEFDVNNDGCIRQNDRDLYLRK